MRGKVEVVIVKLRVAMTNIIRSLVVVEVVASIVIARIFRLLAVYKFVNRF